MLWWLAQRLMYPLSQQGVCHQRRTVSLSLYHSFMICTLVCSRRWNVTTSTIALKKRHKRKNPPPLSPQMVNTRDTAAEHRRRRSISVCDINWALLSGEGEGTGSVHSGILSSTMSMVSINNLLMKAMKKIPKTNYWAVISHHVATLCQWLCCHACLMSLCSKLSQHDQVCSKHNESLVHQRTDDQVCSKRNESLVHQRTDDQVCSKRNESLVHQRTDDQVCSKRNESLVHQRTAHCHWNYLHMLFFPFQPHITPCCHSNYCQILFSPPSLRPLFPPPKPSPSLSRRTSTAGGFHAQQQSSNDPTFLSPENTMQNNFTTMILIHL